VTSALLVVDVQKNMLFPPRPVPGAAVVGPEIEDVIERAREAGALVVHIRNNGSAEDPDAPGSVGWQLVYDVREGEPVVDKREDDAFVGTGLEELLPPSAHVVVVGMQSEYCVRATSLGALERGYPVTLVRGAHATYDGRRLADAISRRAEEELAAAGATVVDLVELAF
jgi:nicotinamidase-related amidase